MEKAAPAFPGAAFRSLRLLARLKGGKAFFYISGGIQGGAGQLPYPCPARGRPFEAPAFQDNADFLLRLAVKKEHHAVFLFVLPVFVQAVFFFPGFPRRQFFQSRYPQTAASYRREF